jgi:hypothetical protein
MARRRSGANGRRPFRVGAPLAPTACTVHDGAKRSQEVVSVCHDWWMLRRFDGSEESRRLWHEFERTQSVIEPEVIVDEPNVALGRDEFETPTPAEG